MVSRISAPVVAAGRCTIDGIADDTVMTANVATHIQPRVWTTRPNSSVLTMSGACSAAANSARNGLPASIPASATRKIAALLSVSIHRSRNGWVSVKVSTARIKSAATEAKSKSCQRLPATPPRPRPAAATASATSTAAAKGTFPTRTQYTIHGARPNSMPMLGQSMSDALPPCRRQAQSVGPVVTRVPQPISGTGAQPANRLASCSAPWPESPGATAIGTAGARTPAPAPGRPRCPGPRSR